MKIRYWFIFPIFTLVLFSSSCSGKGEREYKEGQKFYNLADYTKAAESFEVAIVQDGGKTAKYYIALAMSELELGDYDTALSQLAYAFSLEPDSQEAYRCQGIIYIAKQDYASAITSFNAALDKAEGFVGAIEYDILDYRAVAEMKMEQYYNAINTYTILIEVGHQILDHYYLRGAAHLISGNPTEALNDFKASVNTKNVDYDRYLDIHDMLLKYNYVEDAKFYLDEALRLGKNEDYLNRGKIYYYLGDFDKASLNLEQAKTNGEDEAYLYLGRISAESGDSNTALINFQTYINENAQNGEAYNQVGMIHFNEKDYNQALSYFQQGIATNDLATRKSLLRNEAAMNAYLNNFAAENDKLATYLAEFPEDEAAQKEYDFSLTR